MSHVILTLQKQFCKEQLKGQEEGQAEEKVRRQHQELDWLYHRWTVRRLSINNFLLSLLLKDHWFYFFSKLVRNVPLVVLLCMPEFGFGPSTNMVAIELEIGSSPLLNTVTISLLHLLLEHWSEFFLNLSETFPWWSSCAA